MEVMKTRHIYSLESSIKMHDKSAKVQLDNCDICINANKEGYIATLTVTIPAEAYKSTSKAHTVSTYVVDFLQYKYGSCKIIGYDGFEEIGETEEEKLKPKKVGRTFTVDTIIRADLPENYDDINLRSLWHVNKALGEWANAERVTLGADKYTHYFKIIEDLYVPEGARKIKCILKQSPIREIIQQYVTEQNLPYCPDNLIDNLVDLRDKCSHLKQSKSQKQGRQQFGYSHTVLPELQEINKMIPIIREIARRVLNEATSGDC